jgi:quinoprotein glucose dehydrogenase
VLSNVAAADESRLARLHAIWGLGQIGRVDRAALLPLVELLGDGDSEVRSQAAKVAGEERLQEAVPGLIALLADAEPRPRYCAAIALGKLGDASAMPALIEMLRQNADEDAYLRHAGVMGLTGIGDEAALLSAATDPAPAVRLAALLALRRLQSPEIARFLNDADPFLVEEAARAINDVPIEAALPELAALVTRQGMSDPLGMRVLNANFRLGGVQHARAVADFAARADVSELLRLEALNQLAAWEQPSGRDRVVGLWRPLAPRPANIAADALRPVLPGVLAGPDAVGQAGAALAAKFGIGDVGPLLFGMLTDRSSTAKARAEALKALDALADPRLPEATRLALDDNEPRVRAQGRRTLARIDPTAGLESLKGALADGQIAEQQAAFDTLADLESPDADAVLVESLDRLLAQADGGQFAPELELDLLQAAARRPAAAVQERLARHEAARPADDPLAAYRESLSGGDRERGERIFRDRADVSCVRCHKLAGKGGEVGPELTGIGGKKDRAYLLQALVDPNREIAKGFESVVVITDDGRVHTGIVKEDTPEVLRLMTAEGRIVSIPTDTIEDRARGKSAMPDTAAKALGKSDLRDVVEFLSSLK